MAQSPDNRFIRGDYRPVRTLGSGTFGETVLATRRRDGLQVAVKLLKMPSPPLAPTDINGLSAEEHISYLKQHITYLQEKEQQNHAFSREATTLARLTHPNIVHFYEFDIENGQPFIVMEYALRGALDHYRKTGTPLTPQEAADFVLQAAQGIQYANDKGIVHRDLKPANLLLQQEKTNAPLQVKVADFGIAIPAHSERSLQPQVITGTPAYMAPEQIEGKAVAASDQYALAIIAYEFFIGKLPFEGNQWALWNAHISTNPPTFRAALSVLGRKDQLTTPLNAVEPVIRKGLAKDPQKRFESIAHFATDLHTKVMDATQPGEKHRRPFQAAKIDNRTPSQQGEEDHFFSAPTINDKQQREDANDSFSRLIERAENHFRNKEYELGKYVLAELTSFQELDLISKGRIFDVLSKAIQLDPQNTELSAFMPVLLNKNFIEGYYLTLSTNTRIELLEKVSSYIQAIKINSGDKEAYLSIGRRFYEIGMHVGIYEADKQARKIYQKYRSPTKRLDDDDYNESVSRSASKAWHVYHQSLKTFLKNSSLIKEAIQVFDQVIKISPGDNEAYLAKGEVFISLEMYEEALQVFDQMLSLDPKNIVVLSGKAESLALLGRHEEAIQVFDQVIKISPGDYKAYFHKGSLLRRLGREEEAQEAYARSNELYKEQRS